MATKIAALDVLPARLPSLLVAIYELPRWSILLFAAVCVRALTFGNPVVHVDEEFYFVTAQRMLEGALPYVDVWDRKPIGLFLIYLPPAAFGVPLGIWVYQMMALASVVGTALLIGRLAERAGWGKGALAASLLYIFMLGFGDGQGGQSPVFYNLLVACAFLLVMPHPEDASGDRRRLHRAMLAMALIGISMQIKYSVVFEGMFLGLWLIWREWKLGTTLAHILRRGAVLAAIACVPTLLAGAVYFAIGHGDAWAYANFGSILERRSDPSSELIRAFLKVALILALPLIISGLSRHVPVNDESEHPVRALLFGWLIASVVGLLVFGSWFNHYALPVMVPACLCCAGFLGSTQIGRKVFMPVMLLAAMGGGEYTAWSAMWHRGNAEELDTLANGIGRGRGCLYIHSGDSILYSFTGRCAVTSWIFPSHLSRERENGAVGVDQIAEEGRIFAKKPEVVVMRPEYLGERLEVRKVALRAMQTLGYRLTGRYPLGDQMINVYKLPTARSEGTPRLAANRPS
ncbi:MAG: hypothetical protein ABW023_00195 [Sphingomonas sp.]